MSSEKNETRRPVSSLLEVEADAAGLPMGECRRQVQILSLLFGTTPLGLIYPLNDQLFLTENHFLSINWPVLGQG